MSRKRFQIKSGRDWRIAGIFSFLLIYLVASRFQFSVNQVLMRFTSFRIGVFNQPEDQGTIAVTILLTTVIMVIALLYHKKAKKIIMRVGGTGVLLIVLVMASYYIECHLILMSTEDLQPSSVDVWTFDEVADANQMVLSEEMEEELLSKVLSLKPDNGKVFGDEGNQGLENTITVSIWYPERYNHSYVIHITLTDDKIVYGRYNFPWKDPVVKDNGLREVINEIIEKQ